MYQQYIEREKGENANKLLHDHFRTAQPQMANFVRLAKVELVPSADVGGMLKGVGNLTKVLLVSFQLV